MVVIQVHLVVWRWGHELNWSGWFSRFGRRGNMCQRWSVWCHALILRRGHCGRVLIRVLDGEGPRVSSVGVVLISPLQGASFVEDGIPRDDNTLKAGVEKPTCLGAVLVADEGYRAIAIL
jgi:hypothetical protein